MLKRLQAADGLVVSVDDMKPHLRVDFADDDDVIEAYSRAATAWLEDHTGRIMLPSSWEWRADDWCSPICIPAAPIRDITEVVYLDESNVEQTLDPANWYFVETDQGGEVWFVDGFDEPRLSTRPHPVRIRFEAGYDEPGVSGSGDDAALQPDPRDAQIVKLLTGTWYETRESIVIGASVDQIPDGVKALAAQRRIFR